MVSVWSAVIVKRCEKIGLKLRCVPSRCLESFTESQLAMFIFPLHPRTATSSFLPGCSSNMFGFYQPIQHWFDPQHNNIRTFFKKIPYHFKKTWVTTDSVALSTCLLASKYGSAGGWAARGTGGCGRKGMGRHVNVSKFRKWDCNWTVGLWTPEYRPFGIWWHDLVWTCLEVVSTWISEHSHHSDSCGPLRASQCRTQYISVLWPGIMIRPAPSSPSKRKKTMSRVIFLSMKGFVHLCFPLVQLEGVTYVIGIAHRLSEVLTEGGRREAPEHRIVIADRRCLMGPRYETHICTLISFLPSLCQQAVEGWPISGHTVPIS